MPEPHAPPGNDDLLPGYTGLPGRFDECRDEDGSIRPHWAEFLRSLGAVPSATLATAAEASARAVLEQDVSMNVYAGDRSESKPWPLDVVPLLLSPADWEVLSNGLRQRARLYNTLLADLYGPQKFLQDGVLPARLAMANPHFLRPCAGIGNQPGVFLHHYAADIARSPDGQWWVLQDRLDAPSGFGYSLQNRAIVQSALSQPFNGLRVGRLEGFFRDFQSSLSNLAPFRVRGEDPRVVFLSPGPANETYFEHAYLARHLGHPLVEGADLTTRDGQAFLRTVGGLKRVDAVIRRVDSSFCDPLELDPHSVLGVPGLVHAAHGNRVAIANRLGGAALESASLLGFLKPLCRAVLGEDLRLPSVGTWWCGHPEALAYVLKNLGSLVIKPSFRVRGGFSTRYGALLTESEREALAAEIAANPGDYCGQERVFLGTTPAWAGGSLRPVPFVMRLFVAWQDRDYRVMPGGLTRFDPSGEDAIVSLQRGSVSKDTWVVSAKPGQAPRPAPLAEPDAGYQRPESTPSRVADNFYWFGRYLERTAQMVRLLDRLDPLLRSEVAALDPAVVGDSLRILLAAQQSWPEDGATAGEMAAQIRVDADDPDHPGSLAANLAQLIRVMDQLKVSLPPEFWRILRRLRGIAAQEQPQFESDFGQQLGILKALGSETIAHDLGWRFLMLGRWIERALQLIFLAGEFLLPTGREGPAQGPPGEFRLQTLLHFTDTLFTYRGVYHGIQRPDSIVAWLIAAPENPRGLRFQVDQVAEHLAALPAVPSQRSVPDLKATALRLGAAIRQSDPSLLARDPQLARAFLAGARETLTEINDRLTQVYFSHSEVPEAIQGS